MSTLCIILKLVRVLSDLFDRKEAHTFCIWPSLNLSLQKFDVIRKPNGPKILIEALFPDIFLVVVCHNTLKVDNF